MGLHLPKTCQLWLLARGWQPNTSTWYQNFRMEAKSQRRLGMRRWMSREKRNRNKGGFWLNICFCKGLASSKKPFERSSSIFTGIHGTLATAWLCCVSPRFPRPRWPQHRQRSETNWFGARSGQSQQGRGGMAWAVMWIRLCRESGPDGCWRLNEKGVQLCIHFVHYKHMPWWPNQLWG